MYSVYMYIQVGGGKVRGVGFVYMLVSAILYTAGKC